MSLSFIGFLSLTGAILITIDKDRFKWLVSSLGFKNKSKLAIAFYATIGSALIISGIINNTYVSYFILPASVLSLSLITILTTYFLKETSSK